MIILNLRKRIILGDTTTHGGRVISARSKESYGPYQYARVGDHVFCPKCGSYFSRIEGGPLDQFGCELPYAVEGQRTSCGALLVSRDSLGLIMREDGTIDCCAGDFTATDICENINKYKSGVTPHGPGGFSYSGGASSAPQPQPEKQESVRSKELEKKSELHFM